jgi:hypothetical protein
VQDLFNFTALSIHYQRGFDVYISLVDDQGIDCIIRKNGPEGPKYLDIQIEVRSSKCKPLDTGRFAPMTINDPRENYLFIFYSERLDTYWVINSMDITAAGIANKNKNGKDVGKWYINLAKYS